MPPDNFRISSQDLYSAKVDEVLETQAYLTRDIGEVEGLSLIQRVLFSSWLYLAFWGMVGALMGWGIIEPLISDDDELGLFGDYILFGTVAAFCGLFLGAAEGVMCRNFQRATISGLVGFAVGYLGLLVVIIPVEIIFGLALTLMGALSEAGNGERPYFPLLILVMGRALAWGLISIPAGIGQGIAVKEKKVILNGLLGSVIGGFIGGLAFDPISFVLMTDDGQATYSRGAGFAVIGLVVGLMIGLVEGWTKNAWLLMRKGPLAGKQFIMFKDTTILGSSPKAEIYLFKDDAIEPKHAVIYNRGGRFEIEDCGTPDGTYVNGVAIKRTYLKPGDQIVLGKTVLEFALRESRS